MASRYRSVLFLSFFQLLVRSSTACRNWFMMTAAIFDCLGAWYMLLGGDLCVHGCLSASSVLDFYAFRART